VASVSLSAVTDLKYRPRLGSHLQSMDGSQFLSLLKKVHVSLLRGVEGLQSQENIIVQELELTRLVAVSEFNIVLIVT
jgi:hypothetical protein